MLDLSNQKLVLRPLLRGVFLLLVIGTTACNRSTSAVPTVAEIEAAKTQPAVTGAPEVARINAKGGTKIYALVNGQPITTNDITRRQAFVRLRRMKGNSRTIATDELVSETIKMQEARRIRTVASTKEVDAAYKNFAKNNKMTTSKLNQALSKSGVSSRGFKDYIKAQISWRRAVAARLRAESGGSSGASQKKIQTWLPDKGQDATREKEFTLQQVVFVVPDARRGSLLKARRLQANNFRKRMDGCTNAKSLASSLRDVSVIERGRTLASRLPPRWKTEVESTPAGKVTSIKETQRGLEMLAVCKTREVIGQSNSKDLFSGKGFDSAASKLDKDYYEELKKRAVIKRR